MFGSNIDNGWHIVDLDGHPIFVNPFFLVLIGLFSFMGVSAQTSGLSALLLNVAIWAPTIFLGVLLHELGHATALKRFGYGTSEIVLHGFGGVTINRRRQNAPSGRSIIISLAGPFASFALAVLSFGIYYLLTLVSVAGGGIVAGLVTFGVEFFRIMGIINTVWAVFNLLPINPLDGGHVVLHALRGKLKSRRKAMRYTAITSLVTLGVIVLISLPLGLFDPILFPILVLIFGYQNWQILQASNQSRGRGGPRGRF